MVVEFEVAGRAFTTTLDEVREVVRGAAVEQLPGCRPPVIGVVDVRGITVPVADARPVVDTTCGDILVLVSPGAPVLGVLVDRVHAVTPESDWGDLLPAPHGMPSYVRGLLPRGGAVTPLVDVRVMVELSAAARAMSGVLPVVARG